MHDLERVISETSRVLRPGGLYLYETINRTFASRLVLIKLFQDFAWTRFMPSNLHDWHQFIRPAELVGIMQRHGLRSLGYAGLKPRANALTLLRVLRQHKRGHLTQVELGERAVMESCGDTSILYIGHAIKEIAKPCRTEPVLRPACREDESMQGCRKPNSVDSIRRPRGVPGVNLPAGRGPQPAYPPGRGPEWGGRAGEKPFVTPDHCQTVVDVHGDKACPALNSPMFASDSSGRRSDVSSANARSGQATQSGTCAWRLLAQLAATTRSYVSTVSVAWIHEYSPAR
ncbi:MAG TPA: hypothetical protein VKI99_14880 [Candidatus Dormibacteraeota bacterium]|nr:hypothetical protein [Candidatus Dormibacteraeota bacterium]